MRWLAKHLVVLVVFMSFVAACGGDRSDDSKSGADASATVAIESGASVPLQFAPWSIAPSVGLVAARADDPRIPQVEDAVRFWNEQLLALGSGLRLGPVKRVSQRPPDALLAKISQSIANSGPGAGYRLSKGEFDQLNRGLDDADLVVMLSDGNFISFSSGVLSVNGRSRSLVAIRSVIPLLAQPNIMPNLIAHEMGHSLGLMHNTDFTMLMCGRPAECRPDAFASNDLRYFPLTDADRARLLQLYPATWKPVPER